MAEGNQYTSIQYENISNTSYNDIRIFSRVSKNTNIIGINLETCNTAHTTNFHAKCIKNLYQLEYKTKHSFKI